MSSLDAAKLWSYSIIEMGWSQAQENKNIWNKFWRGAIVRWGEGDPESTFPCGQKNWTPPPASTNQLHLCSVEARCFSVQLLPFIGREKANTKSKCQLEHFPRSATDGRQGQLGGLVPPALSESGQAGTVSTSTSKKPLNLAPSSKARSP